MTGYLIGVDVGSSDCKVLVMDTAGRPVSMCALPYPTRYPRSGWAEQDANTWYTTACKAVRQAVHDLDTRLVLALAIDGPAHNVALLDGNGTVIYPVIHWSDLRSVPQSEMLAEKHGEEIFRISYSSVHPSWTLTQLIWLRQNEPEVWKRLQHILVTKDYVRFRFTGNYATDTYDAIGTQLYDVDRAAWSPELTALAGVDPGVLPEVLPAFSVAGELQPEAARDTGLRAGTPVAICSGDSVVEAFGIGAIMPGDCLVKLGTAANVNLVTERALPSIKTITYRHIIDDRWFTISATNSGAAAMRWFRETFLTPHLERSENAEMRIHAQIEDLVRQTPPGAQGLIFHPYLMGERTPYWDPNLRGDFVGISAQHHLGHFTRAVLEGIAYSVRDCLGTVRQLDQPIKRLFLIGGAARSQLWQQVLSDVLGEPLRKPAIEDTAFGCAMVAGTAVGIYEDAQQAIDCCVREPSIVEPDMMTSELYQRYSEIYRSVTRDLAKHCHALVELANVSESKSVTTS